MYGRASLHIRYRPLVGPRRNVAPLHTWEGKRPTYRVFARNSTGFQAAHAAGGTQRRRECASSAGFGDGGVSEAPFSEGYYAAWSTMTRIRTPLGLRALAMGLGNWSREVHCGLVEAVYLRFK